MDEIVLFTNCSCGSVTRKTKNAVLRAMGKSPILKVSGPPNTTNATFKKNQEELMSYGVTVPGGTYGFAVNTSTGKFLNVYQETTVSVIKATLSPQAA